MSKHIKTKTPSDADLYRNPLIGGSKGATMAGASPDDLSELEGANTIEGDLENDVNAFGGIDKDESRSGAHARHTRRVEKRSASPMGGKHFGPGAQGKGAGTGAMTDLPKDMIGENMILSNRDKAQHTDQRGADSKYVQSEQLQDHAANRLDDDAAE
ncbi:MAG TPA: hypothetical protein VE865_14020 [Bradyrhizobium sp.]|nr:hypothetical protein [Bradyrhizobium sp.]